MTFGTWSEKRIPFGDDNRKSKGKALLAVGAVACLAFSAAAASAQTVIPQPVNDSAVEASPLKPAAKQPVNDSAVQASPITAAHTGTGHFIPAQTSVPIQLDESIDSGRVKNGDSVRARLSAAVRENNGLLPAGTPVELTVVETVPAGKLTAVGEFSLQVIRVGTLAVFTDTQTFRGEPGHRDLPDSAPAIGTDAGLKSGATLTFHVQPPPVAASDDPKPAGNTPGSVTGVASGAPPPKSSLQGEAPGNPSGTGKIPSGNAPVQVTPANTTPAPAQNRGQSSVTPNQPQQPSTQPSASPTQPR